MAWVSRLARRGLAPSLSSSFLHTRREGGRMMAGAVSTTTSCSRCGAASRTPRSCHRGFSSSKPHEPPIKSRIVGSLVDAQQKGLPIEVGMYAELPDHSFQARDVQTFASLSGDDNPLHLDKEYAKKQGIFKGAIVHGVLVGSLFSTIFGVTFPGCIYLQQSFKFSRPVYVGTPVTARVEVTRIRARDTNPPSLVVFCGTHTMDEQGVTAIAGEACVLITPPPLQVPAVQ